MISLRKNEWFNQRSLPSSKPAEKQNTEILFSANVLLCCLLQTIDLYLEMSLLMKSNPAI
jgi:hypothetical protein